MIDDADAVLAGIEALAAGGVQLKAITNENRSAFNDDVDHTEEVR